MFDKKRTNEKKKNIKKTHCAKNGTHEHYVKSKYEKKIQHVTEKNIHGAWQETIANGFRLFLETVQRGKHSV